MSQIRIGVSIKNDIVNRMGTLLVPANTKLKEEDIQKLIRHKIDLSEIEFISDDLNDSASSPVIQFVEDATKEVRNIFDSVRFGHKLPLQDIKKTLVPGIQQATEHSSLYGLINGLKSKDDYTYRHNVGVGVVSTLLGKWLKLDEHDLALLTLAATLHDVGKMKVPNEIINKPGKLTDEEFAIMRKHSIWGYEILKNTVGTSHQLALVALQHHEREDGSGYPFGLKEDKIDYFSKIVSIADVFHAMTSQRSYHEASSFFTVIKQMNQDVFGRFNPKIFFVFLKKMMESMVGCEAILTDGRKGRIVMANPYDPMKPLVQQEQQFIDLSKERFVHLKEILG